jgi:hypothetical protein
MQISPIEMDGLAMMVMILSLLESLQRKMVSDNGTMHAH